MRLLRTCCSMLVIALVAVGCGLGADPVVSSQDEVLDALLALRDGAEGRLTAVLEVDRDEVRDVLRDDAEARALFAEELGSSDGDVDDLLAAIDEARERLAEHALLLATGADGSARVAVASRGEVWLDLRAGGGPTAGTGPDDELRVDLQVRVDWAVASKVLDQPDLLGDLDEAAAQLAPFLGSLPETDAVQRVLLGLLGGELVAISGTLGPDLLDGLGAAGAPGATGDGPALPTFDLDPREALAAALSFGDFRRDGDDTLVDVSLELRAAGSLALDRLAAAPDAAGLTPQDLEEARVELAELPERLTDVAVLRLGPDGTVRQVRTDVVDIGLQLARSTDTADPDVAVVERVAAELDATGLFVVLDVTDVGTTPTVLGTPTASATPEEVAAAFGVLLLRGLTGGLDEAAVLDGLDGLGARGQTSGD